MSDLKNDIEKYLRGDLTATEMHRLEKKALNDPFLADALAGAEGLSAEEFAQDMKDLKQSLQNRVEREKTISIGMWSIRIAAGLIILIITGYILFSITKHDNLKNDLALYKSEAVTSPQPSIKETPIPNSLPQTTKGNDMEAQHPPEPSIRLRTERRSEAQENVLPAEEQPSQEVDVATQQEPVKPNISTYDVAKNSNDVTSTENEVGYGYSIEPPADKPVKQAAEKAKMKAAWHATTTSDGVISTARTNRNESKVLRGKVIDEDGSPMPGVSIALKGSDALTVTDEEGNYSLSFNTDPKGELVFSFVGMQSTEVPISDKDSINAKLSPDFAELSEVVVVGYAPMNNDSEKDEANVYQPANPEGGKKAYKNYLIENLKYPQLAIENKIQGKVTVQFAIESNGNLNDFRVVKGIGHGCDEEVIRLIKQGPKWTPTKRNDIPTKGRVKVRLKFTLPD